MRDPIFWVNLLAILVGPILAVLATRYLDSRKSQFDKRMAIFATLMRTRRTPTVPDHVGALNLVEIEYAGEEAVLGKWRDLFKHFGTDHPRNTEETVLGADSVDQSSAKTNAYHFRMGDERAKLLAKLLHAMGNKLGYRAEQLEIFEGGYTPRGWLDDEMQARAIRSLFADISTGRRALPVVVYPPPSPNPPA